MKYEGDGIDVDKEKAAHYYKKAAEKDNDFDIFKYGKMLDDGDGIDVLVVL